MTHAEAMRAAKLDSQSTTTSTVPSFTTAPLNPYVAGNTLRGTTCTPSTATPVPSNNAVLLSSPVSAQISKAKTRAETRRLNCTGGRDVYGFTKLEKDDEVMLSSLEEFNDKN